MNAHEARALVKESPSNLSVIFAATEERAKEGKRWLDLYDWSFSSFARTFRYDDTDLYALEKLGFVVREVYRERISDNRLAHYLLGKPRKTTWATYHSISW